MKKPLLILAFTFLLAAGPSILQAQKWKLLRYEITGGVGSTNILGDIGGSATRDNFFGIKDFRILQTRPSLHTGLRYKLTANQAVKFNFLYGYAFGSDIGSVNNDRGFSYNTHLFEQSLTYEFYFLSEELKRRSAAAYNRRGMLNNFAPIAAYVFAGVGITESKTNLDADFPPSPERFRYDGGVTPVLPAGIGIKFLLDQRLGVAFEFGGRYTFSDKLDGYNSIYSKAKDYYYFGSAALTYKLKTSRRGFPTFLNRWFNTNRF